MKVFLASSNELAHEREFLAGVVFRLGGLMHGMGTGLRVELVKWEYLEPRAFSGDGELRALFLETVFKGVTDEEPSFRVPAGEVLKKYGLA